MQYQKTLMAEIHFVDFGNTEWVKASAIKPLHNMFFDLPAQGIKCSLAHIHPEEPSRVPPFQLGKEKYRSKDFFFFFFFVIVLLFDLFDWPVIK